jgi:hypothetical protein
MALAGTPEDVRAQVAALGAVTGLSRVIIFPQVADAGVGSREEALTMFALDVVARLG